MRVEPVLQKKHRVPATALKVMGPCLCLWEYHSANLPERQGEGSTTALRADDWLRGERHSLLPCFNNQALVLWDDRWGFLNGDTGWDGHVTGGHITCPGKRSTLHEDLVNQSFLFSFQIDVWFTGPLSARLKRFIDLRLYIKLPATLGWNLYIEEGYARWAAWPSRQDENDKTTPTIQDVS